MIGEFIREPRCDYSLRDFLTEVDSVFGARVVEIDKLPRQLEMATEDMLARVLISKHRNGELTKLQAKPTIQTVLGRLTYGETVTFKIRDPYGYEALFVLRREQPNGDGTDGLRFEFDAKFAEMFQLDVPGQ